MEICFGISAVGLAGSGAGTGGAPVASSLGKFPSLLAFQFCKFIFHFLALYIYCKKILDVFIQFIVSFYVEGPLKISHKGEGSPSLIN